MSRNNTLTARELSEIQHFDKMAKHYDTNYTYNNTFTQYKIHKKLQTLFSHYSSQQKLRILEIGAGTGEYTQYLAELFPKANIIATDISPKILKVAAKKCKKYKNVSFVTANAHDLTYAKNSFDIVCGFYILHHLDIPRCLKEVHRVLKPKGAALFYEPNILNPVVLAIKSLPLLKARAGDSPDEWAINPLALSEHPKPFKRLQWQTSEFLIIPGFVPLDLAIIFDRVSTLIGKLPFLNLLGGSVALMFGKA